MAAVSFEAILERLDAALVFCDTIGLKDAARRSRFLRYRRNLDRLIQIVRLKRQGTLPGPVQAEVARSSEEYMASLTEGLQFGEIAEHLRDADSSVLRSKLRDVLKGPLLASDESATSNRSRNTLFELNLAAHFKRAGLFPVLGEHPDVRCAVADTELFFACKRPFSPAKVEERIREAANQLRKDLRAAPETAGGVITISLGKVFSGIRFAVFDHVPTSGSRPIALSLPFAVRVPNSEFGKGLLNGWLEWVAEATARTWGRYRSARPIVGLLLHVIAVFDNQEAERYDVGQWWVGLSLADPDDAGFLRLGKALAAVARE